MKIAGFSSSIALILIIIFIENQDIISSRDNDIELITLYIHESNDFLSKREGKYTKESDQNSREFINIASTSHEIATTASIPINREKSKKFNKRWNEIIEDISKIKFGDKANLTSKVTEAATIESNTRHRTSYLLGVVHIENIASPEVGKTQTIRMRIDPGLPKSEERNHQNDNQVHICENMRVTAFGEGLKVESLGSADRKIVNGNQNKWSWHITPQEDGEKLVTFNYECIHLENKIKFIDSSEYMLAVSPKKEPPIDFAQKYVEMFANFLDLKEATKWLIGIAGFAVLYIISHVKGAFRRKPEIEI